jgi:hypothetical protein
MESSSTFVVLSSSSSIFSVRVCSFRFVPFTQRVWVVGPPVVPVTVPPVVVVPPPVSVVGGGGGGAIESRQAASACAAASCARVAPSSAFFARCHAA